MAPNKKLQELKEKADGLLTQITNLEDGGHHTQPMVNEAWFSKIS